jgi:hypothetical protein
MNELTVYQNFDTMARAASALQKSGFFPDVKSEAQAIVKVMAGAELGLPPFASMSGIHIVQGKPVLGSNIIGTLVKNDPRYDYRIKTATAEICILEWYENGQKVGASEFTMQEAKDAGLTNKDNWRKYPSDMLFARALTRGARRYAPGIFGGAPVYTPDELGVDTDEEGHIVRELPAETEPEKPKMTAEQAVTDLGYEPETGVMSLETAEDVTNSDGVRYGDLDGEKLANMTIGIAKALRRKDLADDRRAELEFKRDAIATILQARS